MARAAWRGWLGEVLNGQRVVSGWHSGSRCLLQSDVRFKSIGRFGFSSGKEGLEVGDLCGRKVGSLFPSNGSDLLSARKSHLGCGIRAILCDRELN